MLKEMNLEEICGNKIKVSNYDTFAWFEQVKGEKKETFRLDVREYSEKEKFAYFSILMVSNDKEFKKESTEIVKRLVDLLPENINVKVDKTTPSKQAWRYPTFFSYMWVQILIFNLILYTLTLSFVPKGEQVCVLFLFFSIPFGYLMSSGHHWGAGAPYAGFESMIKTIRWKYASLNFFWSLFALAVISSVLKI